MTNPDGHSSMLLETVRNLSRQILDVMGPRLQPAVDEVQASLSEPLRLAVVGRVKAGKSTLVNALVGRNVAPTKAGECTKVVTWYRYGSPDRAEIIRRDGVRIALPFNGELPEDLAGVPVDHIDHLEVHLQAGALRNLTLIDTPGLATTTTENEDGTRRALLGQGVDSSRAASQADAVLYLFRDAERQHEVEFLRDMQDSFGDLGASATTVIGLLSHADLFGSGPWSGEDPFPIAAGVAARLATERAAELGAVIPVAGLLAETARTGKLREADARVLAALAEVDPVALQLAEHLGPPAGVSMEELNSLLGKLGPYGVSSARAVAGAGAEQLLQWLQQISGIGAVEELIHRQFLRRAQALKADHAVAALERAINQAPNRQAGLSVLEAARQGPELHTIRELRALSLLMRYAPNSPLRKQLAMLIDSGSDAEALNVQPGTPAGHLAGLARMAGAKAQGFVGFSPLPAEADASRVIARSFLLMARRLDTAYAGRTR